MEVLKVGNPSDLWESWNDHGKLHFGYTVYVDTYTISIHGPRRSATCRDYFHLILGTSILQLDSNFTELWINNKKKFFLANKPSYY
jgi:hypothetical protein